MFEISGLPPVQQPGGVGVPSPAEQWTALVTDLQKQLFNLNASAWQGYPPNPASFWEKAQADMTVLKELADSPDTPANVKEVFNYYYDGTPPGVNGYAGSWSYLQEKVGETKGFTYEVRQKLCLDGLGEPPYHDCASNAAYVGLQYSGMLDPRLWNE